MTERTNVPVLKTGVGLPTVGSNPTPSAKWPESQKKFARQGTQQSGEQNSPDYSLVVATVTMLSDVLVTVLIVT